MTWSNDPAKNRAFEQGEVEKIRWEVLPYTQGEGLDIGCGDWRLWNRSTGIDQGGRGANIRGNVEKLKFADGSMDYVFSSHCLEDIDDFEAALAEWWRVIRVGGHLALYLPHADLYPRRGQKGSNPAHKHDFLPEDIVKAMQKVAPDWVMRENQERDQEDEYSFLQVYAKRAPGKGQGAALELADPEKRCIAIRWGGFGDVLLASSTFPHLKDQGYHLTVYTGDKGAEVLRHDPHVDRVVEHNVLELNARQQRQLARYLRSRCAKFVNFSGSFEDLFLARDSQPKFWWPHEMRQRYMNGNYLEAAHTVADVPQEYRQKHYATEQERAAARDWRKDMDRLVVIAVTGSGVNKVWPGVFEYAFRMVERVPGLHVAALGDLKGAAFIDDPRIHQLGQTWSMRRSLALAQVADLVIGQETGILNAVAMEPMPKIVLMSHSSAENLTQHWENTATLAGDVPCYPCHRLHADWSGCRQDPETQFAACQAAITPMAAVQLSECQLGISKPLQRLAQLVGVA